MRNKSRPLLIALAAFPLRSLGLPPMCLMSETQDTSRWDRKKTGRKDSRTWEINARLRFYSGSHATTYIYIYIYRYTFSKKNSRSCTNLLLLFAGRPARDAHGYRRDANRTCRATPMTEREGGTLLIYPLLSLLVSPSDSVDGVKEENLYRSGRKYAFPRQLWRDFCAPLRARLP